MNLNIEQCFWARFEKHDEDDEVLDGTEMCINLNINRIIAESDFDIIDVRSQSVKQIENQESEDSCWRLDKNISMTNFSTKLLS